MRVTISKNAWYCLNKERYLRVPTTMVNALHLLLSALPVGSSAFLFAPESMKRASMWMYTSHTRIATSLYSTSSYLDSLGPIDISFHKVINTKEEKAALVASILSIASSTDRGQLASTTEKETIDALLSQLIDHQVDQAIPKPTLSPNIQGTWELLYSSTQLFRSSPFFMAGRAVCSTPEEAQRYDWFCDMHRAALAISTIGKVRQIINVKNGRMISEFETRVGAIPFLGDFTPVRYSGGLPVSKSNSETSCIGYIVPLLTFSAHNLSF